MIKLLDDTKNAIKMVKTNQMISVDNVIKEATKEAITTIAAARKKGKNADEVETTIKTKEEANHEAKRQNITIQTIVGTKEGVIENLNRLVGGNILDTVTKTANASRDKSINNYTLHTTQSLPTSVRQRSVPGSG